MSEVIDFPVKRLGDPPPATGAAAPGNSPAAPAAPSSQPELPPLPQRLRDMMDCALVMDDALQSALQMMAERASQDPARYPPMSPQQRSAFIAETYAHAVARYLFETGNFSISVAVVFNDVFAQAVKTHLAILVDRACQARKR